MVCAKYAREPERSPAGNELSEFVVKAVGVAGNKSIMLGSDAVTCNILNCVLIDIFFPYFVCYQKLTNYKITYGLTKLTTNDLKYSVGTILLRFSDFLEPHRNVRIQC